MRVAIIGAGYVGLVTGACLAERGHRVVCVDKDGAKVRSIAEGRPPFHEPGLEALLRDLGGGRLCATTELVPAVAEAELTLIATGTPFDGRRIDLSYVESAAREIGEALRRTRGYRVVAVKSTVVPGTTDDVVLPILEEASGYRAGRDFGVGMNPEFLSEGTAIRDFREPDRIVIGGIDERTRGVLDALYRDYEGTPRLRTNNATAELIKYASNSLLATMISFSNEIANLCAASPGVDAMEVMRGVHAMRELQVQGGAGRARAAPMASFLSPGCGFGGSCLPKDVKALSAWGAAVGLGTPLLDAVLRVNAERPAHVIGLLERALGSLSGRRVAVLGLAFKPDTDDCRESPAFPLIELLLERGASVSAFDPVARESAARALGRRERVLAPTLDAALDGASAVVIMTRWEHFRAVPELLRWREPAPLLVDGRRMIGAAAYAPYAGVGLGQGSTRARRPVGEAPPSKEKAR